MSYATRCEVCGQNIKGQKKWRYCTSCSYKVKCARGRIRNQLASDRARYLKTLTPSEFLEEVNKYD